MNNAFHLPLEEQLSAFADGELAPEALTQLLADISREDTLRENWHAYHVVGDVLRSTDLAPRATDAAFWSRLEQRLANEAVRPMQVVPLSHAVARDGAPANQRWAWLVGASLSVVAIAVSVGLWQRDVAPAGAQLAAVLPAAVVAAAAPDASDVMIRDPRLDALMQAHQQLGGHSAWQMPSGFLRNATYQEPPR
jgi:sigma-E factor negative regulatory protein RseA